MSSNCVIRQKPGAERDRGEGQERRGTPHPHTPSLTGCNKVEKIIDEISLAGFGQSHCSLHSRVANFTKEEQTTMLVKPEEVTHITQNDGNTAAADKRARR